MAGVGEKGHGNSVMEVELPVRPRKRNVFVFKCPSGPVSDCPLVVDSSGVYFRSEGQGNTFICGHSPPEVGACMIKKKTKLERVVLMHGSTLREQFF